jgi:hypothetical protein
MVERKLTQVTQRGHERVTLLIGERLRERPDHHAPARFGIVGKEDRTEPAVSETRAKLK